MPCPTPSTRDGRFTVQRTTKQSLTRVIQPLRIPGGHTIPGGHPEYPDPPRGGFCVTPDLLAPCSLRQERSFASLQRERENNAFRRERVKVRPLPSMISYQDCHMLSVIAEARPLTSYQY